MEPFYIEDCPKIPVRFIFDCGVRTKNNCEKIFMTHVHTDHSLELPTICNRHKLSGLDQHFHVYAPSSSIKHLILLFRCVAQLSFPDSEFQTDEQVLNRAKVNFHGINAGDKFPIPNSKSDSSQYEMEILSAYHTVQAVGYGLISVKRKLKSEYLAIMTDESIDKRERIKQIENLKKDSNIDLYEINRTPEIAFFCDSSINNLSEHEEWKVYPTIVCECTGLFLEQQKKSESDYVNMGHTCLSQLLPIMRCHKEKKWILIHVSTGIRSEEIERVQMQLRVEEELDIHIYC